MSVIYSFCSFLPRRMVELPARRRSIKSPFRPPPFHAALSAPFPLPDTFSFPVVNFATSAAISDIRPELVGACLWTAGLYLGFSQRQRWGTYVQYALKRSIANVISIESADLLAAFLHSFPFLVAGFGIDAFLRHANESNAVWAVASGLSVAMYAGIYELARQNGRSKEVSKEDKDSFKTFKQFAERRLLRTGRCHLIDVRGAVRQDSHARRLVCLSDETLRKFIRIEFPQAIRSPNGYYRGLSIRAKATTKSDENSVSSSSSID